jgi:uncharacterized protein
LNKTDRIRVNIAHITEDGLKVSGRLPADVFEIEENDRFETPNPLDYELTLSYSGPDILVRGQASTLLRCRCDRCLQYYDDNICNAEVCHYLGEVTDDFLDLTDDVREDIVLLFPQKCLCREECKGLCAECSQNLNALDCDCRAVLEAPNAWNQLDDLQL